MNKVTGKLFYSHLEELLEKELKEDKAYQKCCSDYTAALVNLEKKLGEGKENRELLIGLDEAVGAYSARYHEVVCRLAFHEGLEVGMEHRQMGEQ